jgi:hypothetical protein
MSGPYQPAGRRAGLQTPVRNYYFYGQLLGVRNFELETGYFIRQRNMLSRLVLGYGVVCGLNVELAGDGRQVIIWPGLAFDKWGRDIVVAQKSAPIPVPPAIIQSALDRAQGGGYDEACVQVVICYHECHGDPVPVRYGDCDLADPCAPSTVREQYRIEFRDECAAKPSPRCHVPDLLSDGGIDHDALARWVTRDRNCAGLPADPCIPLANLAVAGPSRCDPGGVDIGVRPVVYSNRVLLELILALLGAPGDEPDYQ